MSLLPPNLFAKTIGPASVPIPTDIEVHPAANVFPMLDEAALIDLAERIARNGQTDPCVLYKGKLLDGRNRWEACKRKGIAPRTVEWDGTAYDWDPYRYVEDVNLGRRQLTPAQRAAVAATFLSIYKQQARGRQQAAGIHGAKGGRGKTLGDGSSPRVRDEGGRAVVAAAKKHGAGIEATKILSAVQEKAPEVVALARDQKVSVQEAKALAQLPASNRNQAVQQIAAGQKAREVLGAPPSRTKKPAARAKGKGLTISDRAANLRAMLREQLDRCPAEGRAELLEAVRKFYDDELNANRDRLRALAQSSRTRAS